MRRADNPFVPADDLDAFVPAELRAMDLDRLVGLTLGEARIEVERAGGELRAIGSDEHQGLPTGGTFDLRRRRVTVVITGGRVVRARGRG
jgi:hypothetical protein